VNPDVDPGHFTGIEAFLSTESLLAGHQAHLIDTHYARGGKLRVDRAAFDKRELAEFLANRNNADDYALFVPALDFIESKLGVSPKLLH